MAELLAGAARLRLYDNTRLSDFKRCPRLFYYRHVRNWRRDGTRVALAFGSAWHSAMEVVWAMLIANERPNNEVAEVAMTAFIDTWTREGMPAPADIDYEQEQELSPRTPGNALEMIHAYIETRSPQLRSGELELISVERPFAVPLDPNDPTLFYVGKIDKIVRTKSKWRAIEHKTTTAYSKGSKFRGSFVDSFSPNSQVDGYLYALHMLSPGAVDGVWVDAALVHKTEQGFKFIPIDRQLEQLDSWLWETRSWIDQVEANKARLEETGTQDRYMPAFPKNTNSCHDFNTSCSYLDLCKAWSNPVGKPLPPGFVEDKWDPLEHLNMEQLELPK